MFAVPIGLFAYLISTALAGYTHVRLVEWSTFYADNPQYATWSKHPGGKRINNTVIDEYSFCHNSCRPTLIVVNFTDVLGLGVNLSYEMPEPTLSANVALAAGVSSFAFRAPTPFLSISLHNMSDTIDAIVLMSPVACYPVTIAPCRMPPVSLAEPVVMQRLYNVSTIVAGALILISLAVFILGLICWRRLLCIQDQSSTHAQKPRAISAWEQEARSSPRRALPGVGTLESSCDEISPTSPWHPTGDCIHCPSPSLGAPPSPQAAGGDAGTDMKYGTYNDFYEAIKAARAEEAAKAATAPAQ